MHAWLSVFVRIEVLCGGALRSSCPRAACMVLCIYFVQAQVANSGLEPWGYCQPASNYAELRERMVGAFAEKESQLSDTVAVMLAVSRDLKNVLNEIHEKCG